VRRGIVPILSERSRFGFTYRSSRCRKSNLGRRCMFHRSMDNRLPSLFASVCIGRGGTRRRPILQKKNDGLETLLRHSNELLATTPFRCNQTGIAEHIQVMSEGAGCACHLALHFSQRHAAAVVGCVAKASFGAEHVAIPTAADALEHRQPCGIRERLKSLESCFHVFDYTSTSIEVFDMRRSIQARPACSRCSQVFLWHD
jgi:hypothetical protein